MDKDGESRKLEEEATCSELSVHRTHGDLGRVCLPTPTCHDRLSYPKTFLQDPVFRDTQLPRCQPELSYALPSESVPLCILRNLLSNPISQTKSGCLSFLVCKMGVIGPVFPSSRLGVRSQ